MPRKISSNKGSSTVEAALIFPVIFFSIAVIMYVCILMYQHALVQALADRAVERGAATWNNPEKAIASGSIDKEKLNAGGLYWRLYDFNKQSKIDRLENYINERMDKYSVLKGANTVETPELTDYIVYKKLSVSMESKFKIPASGIFKMFGLGEYYTINVKSEAVINEPVEFIRNTDFAMDIEKEAEKKYPELKKFGENIRDSMQKIQDVIGKFFDGLNK